MKFDWSVEKKNPMFYFVMSFFLGMVVAGWGWAKNESTKIEQTYGAEWMMWGGSAMMVVGLIGMFFYKKSRKDDVAR